MHQEWRGADAAVDESDVDAPTSDSQMLADEASPPERHVGRPHLIDPDTSRRVGEWTRRAFPSLLLALAALIIGMPILIRALTTRTPPEPPTPVTPVRTTAFYVAPDGNDANEGTLNAPWASLTPALEALRPGDTLYVREGSYTERILNPDIRPGTPDRPITVTAFPGDRPVIRGLLWIKNADHWTFNGINVTWDGEEGDSGEHMVKFTNGVGWSYTNAELWGAQSYAAFLVASSADQEPSDWLIRGNCIHDTVASNDTNQDHLIYVNSGTTGTGGIIDHNLLFGATNGSGIKLGGPSSDSGGATGVLITQNTIFGTRQPILIAWTARDNVVEQNLLVEAIGDDNYRVLRGYGLDTESNIARNNLHFDLHETRPILNEPGPFGVLDDGGNELVDPEFLSTTDCSAFHPTADAADGYGHTAGTAYYLQSSLDR